MRSSRKYPINAVTCLMCAEKLAFTSFYSAYTTQNLATQEWFSQAEGIFSEAKNWRQQKAPTPNSVVVLSGGVVESKER